MWFIGGNMDIYNAIAQIEKDSDRAVGIVAAAMVEIRLTNAIQSRMHSDEAILNSLFRASGALGTFSSKIDLAFLIGIISQDAHRDLLTMKDIRNAFAHKLHIKDFCSQSVRDKCRNFKLVDECIGELTQEEVDLIESGETPSLLGTSRMHLRFKGATEALKDPRKRYVLCTQLFNLYLGNLATSADRPAIPLF